MIYRILLLLALLGAAPAAAQHTFHAVVRDGHSGEPLVGASARIAGTGIGAGSGADGRLTLTGIPDGRHMLVFSYVGYETRRAVYTFPLADPDAVFEVALEEAEHEAEEVTVSATRTSRTIADLPTRVETIAGEEIDEKIAMEPSNISMLLNESPGILVQQTSPTSGNAAIRIQGLDGRYTQLLKDGFPFFGGFSGGLSILQVPPLYLAQVEVIKGPASTLYGGDAIAGIVNLVSKAPTEEAERSVLVNATTAGGFDAGAWYAARGEHLGLTFLASANLQRPYDADEDAFTNLPQTRRLTAAPKLFVYGAGGATLTAGLAATWEAREGGDVDVVGEAARAGFFERNASRRLTSQLAYTRPAGADGRLTLRGSVSHFDHTIEVPGYRFAGSQLASYSEASYLLRTRGHDVVLGLDLRTDRFDERERGPAPSRDYAYRTLGAFVQDTWDVTARLALEAGLRADVQDEHGVFVLPRASVLYRFTETLSGRVMGGLGYKTPTVFLEASEARAFRDVLPLSPGVVPETSVGGSLDVNYRAVLFGRVALNLNQAFYFTTLRDPLVPSILAGPAGERLSYTNADGPVRTRGLETNAKFELDDLKLFLGYVYLDARADDGRRALPLTPAHKTYTVLVFERHGRGRLGLEAYYTGPQRLTDGTRAPGYWVAGVMGERRFGGVSLFVNFENILDTQQGRHAPIVLGPRATPTFAEIWGPTDGFVVNGGVKYTF